MTHPDTGRLHVDVEVQRDGFHLRVALDAVNGVLVLFGPSGAGKSTTLQAIAGLVAPKAGMITLDGQTLFRRGRREPDANVPARARRIGYVFQDYALFPHLTAVANVAYPLWRHPDPERQAIELLDRVLLGGLAHRYPHELSGGQQQRVAIARALAAGPKVLLLDEPFAALDLETRRQVRSEIRKVLQDTGLPVVLVTHDREEALALGDKVAVLDEGRVVAQGDPVALLGHPPRERVARLVGVENLLRLRVMAVYPQEGVMTCESNSLRLEAPLADARVGGEVTIGIRAADIILAAQEPQGLSARNLLRGTVTAVEPRSPGYDVTLDCGLPLVCHVTRGALEELVIRPGAVLWAVVKASSCYVLQDSVASPSPRV